MRNIFDDDLRDKICNIIHFTLPHPKPGTLRGPTTDTSRRLEVPAHLDVVGKEISIKDDIRPLQSLLNLLAISILRDIGNNDVRSSESKRLSKNLEASSSETLRERSRIPNNLFRILSAKGHHLCKGNGFSSDVVEVMIA